MKPESGQFRTRYISDFKKRLEVSIRNTDQGYLIRIETGLNEVGVLFRFCAVFYVFSCYILQANLHTAGESFVRDEFLISSDSEITEDRFNDLICDLERLLFDGLSVLEYLMMHKMEPVLKGTGSGKVQIERQDDIVLIRIQAADKSGLMLQLSQSFYLMDIDIIEAEILTDPAGEVLNLFRISPRDERFSNAEFCKRLQEELTTLL